jgi:hypothetical protein
MKNTQQQPAPRKLTGKFLALTIHQTFNAEGTRIFLKVYTYNSPAPVSDLKSIRYGYLVNGKPVFSVISGEDSKIEKGGTHRTERYYLPYEYWDRVSHTADFFSALKDGYTDLLADLNITFL